MIQIPVGTKFGAWTTVSAVYRDAGKHKTKVDCECQCGIKRSVEARNLRVGVTKSCGCIGRVLGAEKRKTHGLCPRGPQPPEYRSWAHMLQRCYNPDNTAYSYYGARGIEVCEQWRGSFVTFLHDMGKKPSPKHSIERNDNNGPYSPENCRWATKQEQSSNTRRTRRVILNGEEMCLTAAARRIGVPVKRMFTRIADHGVTPQEALEFYALSALVGPRQ